MKLCPQEKIAYIKKHCQTSVQYFNGISKLLKWLGKLIYSLTGGGMVKVDTGSTVVSINLSMVNI